MAGPLVLHGLLAVALSRVLVVIGPLVLHGLLAVALSLQ